MPKRQRRTVPQTELDALKERIDFTERAISTLRQPGASTIQTDNHEKALDPVQGQIIVDHPSSEVKYYHANEWRSLAQRKEWAYMFRTSNKNYASGAGFSNVFDADVTSDESNSSIIHVASGQFELRVPGIYAVTGLAVATSIFTGGGVDWTLTSGSEHGPGGLIQIATRPHDGLIGHTELTTRFIITSIDPDDLSAVRAVFNYGNTSGSLRTVDYGIAICTLEVVF